MEFVTELNMHLIYYINNGNVRYYITVPKNVQSTNITIEFREDMEKYDNTINDGIWVKENVINLFKEIDNNNITLAIPLLSEPEKQFLASSNKDNYLKFEKVMSNYINNIYNLIYSRAIKVDNIIYLIKNEKYLSFIDYFAENHKDRIISKTLLEMMEKFPFQKEEEKKEEQSISNANVITSVQDIKLQDNKLDSNEINKLQQQNNAMDEQIVLEEEETGPKPYKTVTSGGINFVVGESDEAIALKKAQEMTEQQNKTNDINKDISLTNEASKLSVNIPSNIVVGDGQLPNTAGFASYLLIMIVSSIAIFLILYIVIK